ncbi:hypothetical protein [Ciceribacter sp. RN22]|uniref:hypothetical protein n=1 Tax=Ciceribacter sp. RN22 TaxID=2954932 RepID=UPI002093D193|nr:hypothetical protein [Ciceribacter sp. RN22]MCO6178826.1 hypothetical protein [Ciceribacter sp. RN22]
MTNALNGRKPDAGTQQRAPDPASGNSSRIIWTLPAIGRRIGVGADFVRDTLAGQKDSPVKEIGGRYYAFEDDLIAYLRNR